MKDLDRAAPPLDEFEAQRVQERLRADLFGVVTPARHFDRFVVIDRIGEGAMGAVYAAYDPRLDRKVAIKVLHQTLGPSTDANARLVREARALARLDHPNVVTVHEVGTFEDKFFIAMEFVDGTTLRGWIGAERSVDEVIEMFVESGMGLAAAHDAGLVHRDFKPDNVLVAAAGSARGRARVADFGLVHLEAGPEADREFVETEPELTTQTQTGAVVGTLAYMAPEQHRGEPVTPASDQFAFCVALFEALTGARPFGAATRTGLLAAIEDQTFESRELIAKIPTSIRRAVLRGLSAEPGRRWPDMHTLLAQLRRKPRWRLPVFVGSLALATVGVAAWASAGDDPCVLPRVELAQTYNPAIADRIVEAVGGTPVPAAQEIATDLRASLDDYAAAWWTERASYCEAAARGDEAALRSAQCLDAELEGFSALLELLASPDQEVVRNIPSLAPNPADLADCKSVGTVFENRPDPQVSGMLARAKAMAHAGERDQARATTQEALARADNIGNLASQAQALIRLARAEVSRQRGADALALLDRAAPLAERSGDDVIRVDGLRARVAALVRLGRVDEAAQVLQVTRAAVERFRVHPVSWDTELDTMAGDIAGENGDHEGALAHYRRGLERADRGLGSPIEKIVLISRISSIYIAQEEFTLALETQQTVRHELEEAFGPHHPGIASSLVNSSTAAFGARRHDEAESLLRRALALREQVVDQPDDPSLAGILINLGAISLAKDSPEAEGFLRRARRATLSGLGENHKRALTIDLNLALVLEQENRLEEAEPLLRNAVQRVEVTAGAGPVDTAKLESVLGSILFAAGREAAARGHFSAALDKLASVEDAPQRYRVRPVCSLARLAVSAGEDADVRLAECRELAAVIGKPRWKAISAAAVLLRADEDIDADALLAEIEENVEHHQLPEYERRWVEQTRDDYINSSSRP